MTPKKCTFPLEVKEGSVRVKIYRVTNKGNPSYVVCHYLDGRRKLKAFVDFKEAHEEAKSIASNLARGELDVLQLKSADRLAYGMRASRPPVFSLQVTLAKTVYASGRHSTTEKMFAPDETTAFLSVNMRRLCRDNPVCYLMILPRWREAW